MTGFSGNILIVEDEEAHAVLTIRAIRKAGHKSGVDVVSDGEQALDYLFNRGKYSDKRSYPTPGMVLLDIKLPGVDGIQVLKTIKEHPDLKRVLVIMLTTSKRDDDISASYYNYANSYVTKPAGFKDFQEKVVEIEHYWMNLNEPPSFLG